MDNKKLAEQILQSVGGTDNVSSATHCITRIRFHLNDERVVKDEEVKQIPGVLGVARSGGQYQVIVGNKVGAVFNELQQIADIAIEKEEDATIKQNSSSRNLISRLFEIIASMFTPIIPVVIGAGMLKGLLSLLTAAHWVTPESGVVVVLTVLSSTAFYFLPMLLAFTAANKFKTNPYIAVVVAGILLHPDFAKLRAEGLTQIDLLGVPLQLVEYSSSVLPILLAVITLSYVEKMVTKIIPSSLKIVFEPMIILLIVAPIVLTVLGPLGFYAGNTLALGFSWLYSTSGLFAGLIFGATFSLIVITGMHYGLVPLIVQSVSQYGFDYIKPLITVANIGQAGASFAVFLKTKSKTLKSVAGAATFSALMGVTEPAIYGVTMKLKKPFIGAAAGGAVGGAIAGIYGVKAYGYTLAGLPGIPLFLGETFVYLVIAMIASFIVAAAVTWIIGFQDIQSDLRIQEVSPQSEHPILSPMTGRIHPLSDVPDDTFKHEMMGKGIALFPDEGKVVSPIDGTIAVKFKTGHALIIASDEGAEILIHIGVDTVKLKGRHFVSRIEEGDRVKAGDVLIEFDMNAIQQEGYNLITPIVITNSDQYSIVDLVQQDHIHMNHPMFKLSPQSSCDKN